MDVGEVTLGGSIDRLEAADLVKRQPDPQDRRARRGLATPKGTGLLTEIQVVAKDVNARIMNGIAKAYIGRAETVVHKMKLELISMGAVPDGSATAVELRFALVDKQLHAFNGVFGCRARWPLPAGAGLPAA